MQYILSSQAAIPIAVHVVKENLLVHFLVIKSCMINCFDDVYKRILRWRFPSVWLDNLIGCPNQNAD